MATKTRQKSKAKPKVEFQPIQQLSGRGVVRSQNKRRLELRDLLQMTRPDFRRIVNVSERAIAKVEDSAKPVEKLRRPYNEVYRLYRALEEVVDSKSLGSWFMTPNKALGNLTPTEVIERGEIDRLWEIAFRLRSGMPV